MRSPPSPFPPAARRPALLVALLSLLVGCASATSADRERWLTDFEQLTDHMAAVYANLEWVVEERGLDPYTLSERARAELAASRSRRSARKVVERFVKAFDDPHFHVRSGEPRSQGGGEPGEGLPPDLSADDALDAVGFRERNLDFRIDFEKLPDFERLMPSPENPFAWAIFRAGEQRVGVVRIAHFGEDGYPKIARRLWPAYAETLAEPCDVFCQWRFRERVMDALLGYLAEGARALADQEVDAVLIDISGNGGGTDWAAVAPRIFAPPLTRCPPLGVVRHPHHAARMTSRRAWLDSLLEELELTDASRRMLEAARDSVASLERRTKQPCDRRSLFRSPQADIPCTQLAFSPGCGIFEYLPPGSLADVEERAAVFRPLGSSFEESIWEGPLFVVTDRRTASASEHFVALLRANRAATLLGERTLGAGCGFIGGGVPAYLPNLDLTVWMPDCARYDAEGRNEIEGFAPDVPLEWEGGDDDRARRIHAALVELL